MTTRENQTPEISLTIFKNKYDVSTKKRMNLSSFDDFEVLLEELSKIKYKKKEDAALISPAVYKENSTRNNENVVEWGGWAALDIDDWKEGDPVNAIRERFSHFRYICYSTASSTYSNPKFRIVFGLSSRVSKDKIPQFWYALNELVGNLSDRQVKDMSRMYYVPGHYFTGPNILRFFDVNRMGSLLVPLSLIEKYPMPEKENFFEKLPEHIQKAIIEKKKSNLNNTNITWTNKDDCPFWSKELENRYKSITNTGWYHTMYQIMVSIANKAVYKNYPIMPNEIAKLCSELDLETGGWYKKRNMEKEAERAIEFVYKNHFK